jgi:hypothetical protein
LLLVLCAAALPARAADRPLPAALRGIWAAPACAGAQTVLVYGAHFVLHATPDGAAIEPVALRADDSGFVRIAQGPDTFFLESGGDSLTRTGLRVRDGVWPERLDARNPALAVERFVSCVHPLPAWPALHPDGLAAFALLNGVRPACDLMAPACAAALFSAADRDESGQLDYREIALAWRQSVFLAAARGGCFGKNFPGTTGRDGPGIAAALIGRADRDGNGALSLAEMRETGATSYPPLPAGLGALLPALRGNSGTDQTDCAP